MRLVILYRTYPRENKKARPAWYSRPLALASLRAALDGVDADVRFCFIADGALPTNLEEMRQPGDDMITIQAGRAALSLRKAIRAVSRRARNDPEDTLYWFAEDDYLYRPEAIRSLVAAARELPEVDYFTLYVPDDTEWYAAHPSQPLVPVPSLPGGARRIGDVEWDRTSKTTSTFGVRRDALLSDGWLINLISTSGAMFDAATMTALQGHRPWPWRTVNRGLHGSWSKRGVAKVLAKPVIRSVINVAATVNRPHRMLVAPVQDLSMHLEAAVIPPGEGWEELAEQV